MASTSSTKLLAVYLVVLFMVFAAAKAQVETCPSTLLDDLKNTCSDAATNASVAPSAACCGVVGSASTSCLCNALIEWGTGKVDMNATLAIPKTCAVYVKAGSTCAGKLQAGKAVVLERFLGVIGRHLRVFPSPTDLHACCDLAVVLLLNHIGVHSTDFSNMVGNSFPEVLNYVREELVEFENLPDEVQDFTRFTDRCRGISRMHLK